MKLEDLSVDMLRQAVERYLAHAYPEGEVPPAVTARLACLDACDLGAALASEAVESEASRGGAVHRFLLRLGSAAYPNLKLALERCSGSDSYVFSVDTHDRHFLPEGMSAESRARFEQVQAKNSRLKAAIERDWADAGLPTFRTHIEAELAALRCP